MWYITYVAGDGLLTEEQVNTTPSLTQAVLSDEQEIYDVFIGRWSKVSEEKEKDISYEGLWKLIRRAPAPVK